MATLTRFISNIRIGVRLGGAFTGVCLCMIVALGIGLWGQSKASDATAELVAAAGLRQDSQNAEYRTADLNGWQNGYAFDVLRGVKGAADDTVGQRRNFVAATAKFREAIATLRADQLDAEGKAHLDAAESAFTEYMRIDQQIIELYRAGSKSALERGNTLVATASNEQMGKVIESIETLLTSATGQATAAETEAHAAAATARTFMIVAGLLALGLAALLAVLVTRSITGPLSRTVATLREVADKNLTVRAPDGSADELGVMGRAVNSTLEVLLTAFGRINDNSRTLSGASRELSTASARIADAAASASGQSDQVAASAEEVSRSVQTVAAGTEEMNAAIREISGSASQAAAVAASGVKDLAQETTKATGDIAAGVTGVATAAQVTSAGVEEAQQTAQRLENMSRELHGIVDQFQISARR